MVPTTSALIWYCETQPNIGGGQVRGYADNIRHGCLERTLIDHYVCAAQQIHAIEERHDEHLLRFAFDFYDGGANDQRTAILAALHEHEAWLLACDIRRFLRWANLCPAPIDEWWSEEWRLLRLLLGVGCLWR